MIFIYLKGTPNFGLWYKKVDDFSLKVCMDVDWDKCVDDRRRTSCGEFFLGDRLISQLGKKWDLVSLFIAGAKYIIAISYCTQVMWMK